MYKQDLFKDKVALVTGGRSGIGFGIAKKFLELGASVFICSRNEEKLTQAAQELNEIGPCAFMPCDIRQEEQLKENGVSEVYNLYAEAGSAAASKMWSAMESRSA